MAKVDLSLCEYKEWVQYVFNVPPPQNEDEGNWREDIEDSLANPAQCLVYFTLLCKNFAPVAARYSAQQIDQGFWLLLGSQVKLPEIMMDDNIPLENRLAFISAMRHPFEDVLPRMPELGKEITCFHMWFDLVASGFWSIIRFRANPLTEEDLQRILDNPLALDAISELANVNPDDSPAVQSVLTKAKTMFTANKEAVASDLSSHDHSIHDALYDTLSYILNIDCPACQSTALHGLGHLRHPKGPALIQHFLDTVAQNWSAEYRSWIEQCRDGTVM